MCGMCGMCGMCCHGCPEMCTAKQDTASASRPECISVGAHIAIDGGSATDRQAMAMATAMARIAAHGPCV